MRGAIILILSLASLLPLASGSSTPSDGRRKNAPLVAYGLEPLQWGMEKQPRLMVGLLRQTVEPRRQLLNRRR